MPSLSVYHLSGVSLTLDVERSFLKCSLEGLMLKLKHQYFGDLVQRTVFPLVPSLHSGVISPLFSNSILGTYRPGEFIFQCPIFLPFHIVHGILKARILKWFAISLCSGPHFIRNVVRVRPLVSNAK